MSILVFPCSCFIIEADKTDHNRVIGRLKVNPDFPIFIDYEKYEVLYLAIFVTDLNQEVNEGTADGTQFPSYENQQVEKFHRFFFSCTYRPD